MRHYQLIRAIIISLVGYNLTLFAFVVSTLFGLLLHLLGFSTLDPLMGLAKVLAPIFALFLFVNLVSRCVLKVLLLVKGPKIDVCSLPDGGVVEPSGVWLAEDAELHPGDIVFAQSGAGLMSWYRAQVVRMLSRNRVMVHYVGWDPFWDEPFRKRNLQAPLEANVEPSATETGIRNAN
jgi:hypothetical protein